MPSSPGSPDPSRLAALAADAQRAFRARPSLSIRSRLSAGFVLWFILSIGVTVLSIVLMGRAQAKLTILGAVDRYAFEVQQARRFEKNYFLYGTDLREALVQVHAAQEILHRESPRLADVVGTESVRSMRSHMERYEELLSFLARPDSVPGEERLRSIEAELRLHGAEMVDQAENLASRERSTAESLLRTSQRIAVGFLLTLLVVIGLLGRFIAHQMLAPLNRIMLATRRIAGGDLTPITPRRKYHDEFSELADAINYMMNELVQRQQVLSQSHKLQAIGTLTAGVAHELNNPINNIMLTASTLEEDYYDFGDRERLEMARDLVSECERARKIVGNLLDFARETDVELAAIDVEEIVGETLQLASNQVKLAKVRVRGEVQEGLSPIHGDRRQLIQVFLNLVLNALDAMPGGGTLTISVARSEDGGSVEVSFADTGVGIPTQHLGKIFDPFFSTKKQARGTGLGLSVSLGILEQHGGDIRVVSEPGSGTVFTVSLPIARVPARMDGSLPDDPFDMEPIRADYGISRPTRAAPAS